MGCVDRGRDIEEEAPRGRGDIAGVDMAVFDQPPGLECGEDIQDRLRRESCVSRVGVVRSKKMAVAVTVTCAQRGTPSDVRLKATACMTNSNSHTTNAEPLQTSAAVHALRNTA